MPGRQQCLLQGLGQSAWDVVVVGRESGDEQFGEVGVPAGEVLYGVDQVGEGLAADQRGELLFGVAAG